MSKALVAIGVSRAPPLTPLTGAITDAQEIGDWARAAAYKHVHVLTDQKPKSVVRARDVVDCCHRLLDLPDLEQLVIYFSGHGYCPLPGNEIWLLSGWNDDANEAINASTSILLAKGIETPRIAFIADACRDTSSELLGTTGIVILPKPRQRSGRARVDEFYATAFGDISQQYKPVQRRKSYGVFSKALLQGLKGGARVFRHERHLVTSRSLEDHLTDEVPKACAAIQGAVIQYPDINSHWREPDDIYVEFAVPPPVPPGRGGLPPPAVEQSRSERNRQIGGDAQRFLQAKGRESFETATGATIIGAEVVDIVHSAGGAQVFPENDAWQVRVLGDGYNEMPMAPIDLLVQVNSRRWRKHWLSIPAYPGLIATAVVDDNGFSSLNYRAARRFQDPYATQHYPDLDALSAQTSAMFRFGLMPPRDQLLEIVDKLRDVKFENPAFAVLAAHICYRIGEEQQIVDMENYPIGRGWYTPYDFLLITGRDTPRNDRTLVGRFPLLSAGWGLLAGAEFEPDERLRDVPAGLIPSVWTFADERTGAILADIVSGAAQSLAEPAYALADDEWDIAASAADDVDDSEA